MAKANKTEGWATKETVDWSKQSAEGPPPLAKDVYRGKIVSAEATTAGEKDRPCIKIVFEASENFAGDPAEGSKKCYSNIMCTQESAWKVLQLANALGIDPPIDFGFDTLTEYAENLVGQELYARVEPRKYDGRELNDLKRFLTEDAARQEVHGKEDAEVVPMRRAKAAE